MRIFRATLATIAITAATIIGTAGAAQALTQEQADQCARATLVTPAFCTGGAVDNTDSYTPPTTSVLFVDKAPVYIGNDPVTGDRLYLDPVQDRPGQRTSDSTTYFDGRDYYGKLSGPA
jgi:hypothetical protein